MEGRCTEGLQGEMERGVGEAKEITLSVYVMGKTTEFSFLSCLMLCGVISPSSMRLKESGVKGQSQSLTQIPL